jgi:hypothetical protein
MARPNPSIPKKKNKEPKLFELNEANLERFLDQHDTGLPVHVGDLEFPLNDSSYGVQDFRDWKYFKDMVAENVKVVSIGHSFLWSNETLEKLRKQGQYKQYIETPKISTIKQTKIERLRLKRAKAMLARWNGKKSTTMYTTGNKYPGAEPGSPSSTVIGTVLTTKDRARSKSPSKRNNTKSGASPARSSSPTKSRK